MTATQSASASSSAPKAGGSFPIHSRVFLACALVGALVLGGGGWAVGAKLSGAVIAQGKVAVKRQVKLVQHRDGGIVAEILVSNGDAVSAGDVLIRLDETQTKAELAVMKGQLAEYQGRWSRLSAERDGAQSISFDTNFESDAISANIARGEVRLFENNRSMRDGQREQLMLQAQQLEEQVHGLRSQQESNAAERTMVADDLTRLRPLSENGVIEVTKIRTLERDLAKIDGIGGEIESNIARVMGQISEAKLKTIELDQTIRTDAQRELREIDARIAELEERIVAATDRLSRMEIRASASGTVNELSVHSLNGVIAPGQTVMSIVPDGEEMTVEARLSPADIDQVAVGQIAKLRFSAFNQRTTPEIPGTVAVVAAAATLDVATGQPYYLSEIAIGAELAALGDRHLVPGMPVEVFLSTGERSAMSYLVKPFTDQMMRAFREE